MLNDVVDTIQAAHTIGTMTCMSLFNSSLNQLIASSWYAQCTYKGLGLYNCIYLETNEI